MTPDEMEMYLLLNGWTVERGCDDWWMPPKGSKSNHKILATRSF